MKSAKKSRQTVLVVEDEELVREIVIWAFEDLGFEARGAATGDEAALMLAEAPVDLLFTDIRMPGRLDGWTLAEKMRETWSGLPVIYASGYSSEPPRQVPNSIFLEKPLATQALREALIKLDLLDA
ncbi:MAG: response regulator [Beijerinckiaceae bacterium]|jgi:CheY-like chemotaxis protein|nr:response regulator [Beijerinckiaceae bacterium]MDO9443586.1 response regulator [Beijerinckiaceae bacterium]